MRKHFAALIIGVILSTSLAVWADGFPSRPRFLSLGVGTSAPSTNGDVAITGDVTADSFSGDIDASNITSGTLPAGRFPADASLQTIEVNHTAPAIKIYNSTAATTKRAWRWITSGADLYLQALADNYTGGENIIKFTRGTGADVTDITFDNGNVDVDENFNVDGTTTLAAATTIGGVAPCLADGTGCTTARTVKTADTSRTSTTSDTCDPTLTISNLPNGSRWALHALLEFDGNGVTAGGFRVRPLGSNATKRADMMTATANTSVSNVAAVSNSSEAIGNAMQKLFDTAGAPIWVTVDAMFETTSATNSICISWAQSVTNGTATDLQTGSYMILSRLP